MTPVMSFVMGVQPMAGVGTDLAYGAVTKIVGAATHRRRDEHFLNSGRDPLLPGRA